MMTSICGGRWRQVVHSVLGRCDAGHESAYTYGCPLYPQCTQKRHNSQDYLIRCCRKSKWPNRTSCTYLRLHLVLTRGNILETRLSVNPHTTIYYVLTKWLTPNISVTYFNITAKIWEIQIYHKCQTTALYFFLCAPNLFHQSLSDLWWEKTCSHKDGDQRKSTTPSFSLVLMRCHKCQSGTRVGVVLCSVPVVMYKSGCLTVLNIA